MYKNINCNFKTKIKINVTSIHSNIKTDKLVIKYNKKTKNGQLTIKLHIFE